MTTGPRVRIRRERPSDRPAIADLVRRAFADSPYSDHQETALVDRLRQSAAFVPALAIVAEIDGVPVGHVLLTRVGVACAAGPDIATLALGPLSVVPEHQRRGIGGTLIEHAHRRARRLGFAAIVVIGHPRYYPRFGYRPLAGFGLAVPFEVPPRTCMALELTPLALHGASGSVAYPPAWLATPL